MVTMELEQALERCGKDEITKALFCFALEQFKEIKKNNEENDLRIEKLEKTIKKFSQLTKSKEQNNE